MRDPAKILTDATRTINRNHKEHGNTERSFLMIAELWTVYVNHVVMARNEARILPCDVAQMMSLLKKARALYGYSEDHWIDDCGYVSLAAMLTPQKKEG